MSLEIDCHEAQGCLASATFSSSDKRRIYRYRLTRQWAEGALTAFVLLNPSTADAFTLDPTLRRCQDFAKNWGSGGLVVLNAFGLRSTDPKMLRSSIEPIGPDNDLVIVDTLRRLDIERVIVGWGADPSMRDRAGRVLNLILDTGHQPMALGVTKEGFPRHPLYLRADSVPTLYEFDISTKVG